MMVVYYKDKNGNITHHQIASKDTDNDFFHCFFPYST